MNSTKENIIMGSIILFQIFWSVKIGDYLKQPEFFIPNEISVENFFFYGAALGAGLFPIIIVGVIWQQKQLKKAKEIEQNYNIVYNNLLNLKEYYTNNEKIINSELFKNNISDLIRVLKGE